MRPSEMPSPRVAILPLLRRRAPTPQVRKITGSCRGGAPVRTPTIEDRLRLGSRKGRWSVKANTARRTCHDPPRPARRLRAALRSTSAHSEKASLRSALTLSYCPARSPSTALAMAEKRVCASLRPSHSSLPGAASPECPSLRHLISLSRSPSPPVAPVSGSRIRVRRFRGGVCSFPRVRSTT